MIVLKSSIAYYKFTSANSVVYNRYWVLYRGRDGLEERAVIQEPRKARKSNRELVEYVNSSFSINARPRSSYVIDAMRVVDRKDFLPPDAKQLAYYDEPVGIGYGQTCSQPSLVALMLDELSVRSGDRILEIGSGCGYAAAIASLLCGPEGRVYACEIVPELAAFMRVNLGRRFPVIEIIEGDGSSGFTQLAPFDRILLSAGVDSSSFDRDILLSQLAVPGIMIYPEACGRLYKLIKTGEGIEERSYGYVSFVPLRGRNA
jgi:protein-L-isoaspartate(D-aspartate) O-methyltransferase